MFMRVLFQMTLKMYRTHTNSKSSVCKQAAIMLSISQLLMYSLRPYLVWPGSILLHTNVQMARMRKANDVCVIEFQREKPAPMCAVQALKPTNTGSGISLHRFVSYRNVCILLRHETAQTYAEPCTVEQTWNKFLVLSIIIIHAIFSNDLKINTKHISIQKVRFANTRQSCYRVRMPVNSICQCTHYTNMRPYCVLPSTVR
jgi:hypothetical protein